MVNISVAEVLDYLINRSNDDWLIDYDIKQFNLLTEELWRQLNQLSQKGKPPKILLAEANPLRFLASFLAAVAANCPVFLCNPNWGQQEWQQVFNLVQPDLIWGLKTENWKNSASLISPFPQIPLSSIMIPTGGSSGKIHFAIHSWKTLTASVRGFYQYFGGRKVNSFCILPLYHVSGLMQFLRSFLTGGNLVILPYQDVKVGKIGNIIPEDFFISLVPTQLQYLLQKDPSWLSHFHTVLLGGAPAWQELLDTAREYHIRLAPTYGMTETASQIVTLKPEDFLNNNNSSGQVLPHAEVTICNSKNEILDKNQSGIINIKANSLYLGYYPKIFTNHSEQVVNLKTSNFLTDDIGFFDSNNYLYIVGRNSYKIITGGENVFPSEVEAAILNTKLVEDVCVLGLPDAKWGQVVTAIYVSRLQNLSPETMKTLLKDKLSGFKHPKYWVQLAQLPRNQQGKLNCEKIKQIAKEKVAFLQP